MLVSFALLALATPQVSAFPALLSEAFLHGRSAAPDAALIDTPCPHMKELAKRQAPGVTPPFNAKQQYVSTTGAHAFKAPGPDDQRGPCPGLNAMANHGYMPHNGVGSINDFITGTQAAFGMGESQSQ